MAMKSDITKKQDSTKSEHAIRTDPSNNDEATPAIFSMVAPGSESSINSTTSADVEVKPTKPVPGNTMSLLELVTPTIATVASSDQLRPVTAKAKVSSDRPTPSQTAGCLSTNTSHVDTFWRHRRISKEELLIEQNRICKPRFSLTRESSSVDNDSLKVSRQLDDSSSHVDDEDEDGTLGGLIAIGITLPFGTSPAVTNGDVDPTSAQVSRELPVARQEGGMLRLSVTGNGMSRTASVAPAMVHGNNTEIPIPASLRTTEAFQGQSHTYGTSETLTTRETSEILSCQNKISLKQHGPMELDEDVTRSFAASRQRVDSDKGSASLNTGKQTRQCNDNQDETLKARSQESYRAIVLPRSFGRGASIPVSRAQQEIWKSRTNANDGPSLAPASNMSTLAMDTMSIARSRPGAVAVMRASSGEEMKRQAQDTGPNLAPPAFSTSSVASIEAPVVEETSTEVPVGAYAIEGMDAMHASNLSDDEYSITDQNRRHVQEDIEGGYDDIFYVDPDAQAMQNALTAELQVVVDGNILMEDENEPLDPKAMKKLRWYQLGILCFSLMAIALMIGAFLGFAKNDDGSPLGWNSVGSPIYGSQGEAQLFFGQSLVLTNNGTRILVAAPGFEDKGTQTMVGEIRIFNQVVGFNGTEWQQVGSITGEEKTDSAHMSVSASQDGHLIAIGQSRAGNGLVEIYEESSGVWRKIQRLVLSSFTQNEQWYGFAVNLSPDGSVLAVAAPMADSGLLTRAGVVRVYKRTEEGWLQLGDDIGGSTNYELQGWSLSLQMNESYCFAVGAPSGEGETGLVRVFAWSGSYWQQIGETLYGKKLLGRFGETVALSSDCRVLSVGAPGTAFVPGRVSIYRWDSEQWIEDSHDFLGQEPSDAYGSSVSLSQDGNILAIGAGQADAGRGRIEIFKFEGIWKNDGMPIVGNFGDNFGSEVKLAQDGRRVVIGAPMATFDGSVAQAGAVYVYDRDE